MNRLWFPGRRLPGLDREDGFGLVEAVMAMGIIFVSLLALVYTTTIGFADIALARQRQAGDGIANRIMEEVHALSYAVLSHGLADVEPSGAVLTADPNIVSCAGSYYFKTCPAVDPNAELIVHTAGLTATTPLVPHQGTIGPPNYPETYNWSVYVTAAKNVPTAGAIRTTVLVTWTTPAKAGNHPFVQLQSLVSPASKSIPSTLQVAGSASAALFYGTGTITKGSVTITPVTSAGNPTGIDLVQAWNSVNVDLESVDANLQTQQLASVGGQVTNVGGRTDVGGTVTLLGAGTTTTAASNSPGTAAATFQTGTIGPTSPGTLTICGTGGTANCIGVRGSGIGSNSGQSTSTTFAGGSNPCNGQANNRPCGYGQVAQGQDFQAYIDLRQSTPSGALNAGNLVNIAAAYSGTAVYESAYGRRTAGSGGDGTVKETVTRDIPYSTALADLPLPGGQKPSGWAGGWVKFTGSNYQPTATAGAGIGAAAPSISVPGGLTIAAWNGSGYTNIPVTTAGTTICPVGCANSISALAWCYQSTSSLSYLFNITGSLAVGASYTRSTTGAGGAIVDSTAVIGSPLSGSVSYTVTKYNGSSVCAAGGATVVTELANLSMAIDFGTATAHASYQPA